MLSTKIKFSGALAAMFMLATGNARKPAGYDTPGAFGNGAKRRRSRRGRNVGRGYYARYTHALSEMKITGTPTSRKRQRKIDAKAVKRINRDRTQGQQLEAMHRSDPKKAVWYRMTGRVDAGRNARRAARNA